MTDDSPIYDNGEDTESPELNQYKAGYDQLVDMETMQFVKGCYIKIQYPVMS